MVTARLLTDCSNTQRNMHTNARENITKTRAKRKAGNFFGAHSVDQCFSNFVRPRPGKFPTNLLVNAFPFF